MAKVRLPIVWKFTLCDFESDSECEEKRYRCVEDFYNDMDKTKILEGDIICPYDYDFDTKYKNRKYQTVIIGKNKKYYQLSEIDITNALVILPAWAIELGMRNGHSFEQLMEVYNDGTIIRVIYPRSMQEDNLKIKDRIITSVRMYDYDEYEDMVFKECDSDYYDLEDFLYEDDIFLDIQQREQEILDFIKYRLGYYIKKRRKVWYSPDHVWKSTGLSMIDRMKALEAHSA